MANENYRNELSQAASSLLLQLAEGGGEARHHQLAELVLDEFAKSVGRRWVGIEREACAKIAEGYANLHLENSVAWNQSKKTAAKIRARGQGNV